MSGDCELTATTGTVGDTIDDDISDSDIGDSTRGDDDVDWRTDNPWGGDENMGWTAAGWCWYGDVASEDNVSGGSGEALMTCEPLDMFASWLWCTSREFSVPVLGEPALIVRELVDLQQQKQRTASNRVPTLLLTKNPGLFQDFPGLPWIIFQDLFGARECLNTKKKSAFMKCRRRQNSSTFHTVFKLSNIVNTNWVLHYCCLFSIWTTRKMHDIDIYIRLSWTIVIFQNFQVLEFSRKNPGLSRRRGNPVPTRMRSTLNDQTGHSYKSPMCL